MFDITMNKVENLSSKALVGKQIYIKMKKPKLKQWIWDYWKTRVGYCLRFILPSNHWIVFHFLEVGDMLKILEFPWILGRGVLMLKRWEPIFSPYLESFSKICVWMFLPYFPIELWVTRIF